MTWPYPGDSPVARARRVAHAYRARLEHVDPVACAEVDAAMRGWGQTWAVPRLLTVDPDAWISAADAADLAAVGLSTLRELRRLGRLAGRRAGHRWEYRVRDIIALGANPRRRPSRNGSG